VKKPRTGFKVNQTICKTMRTLWQSTSRGNIIPECGMMRDVQKTKNLALYYTSREFEAAVGA
jgi:hypothetical protein